jgi:hypothetical protein
MSRLDDVASPTLMMDRYYEQQGKTELSHCDPSMTVREYAAIHLRIPDSGIKDLDAMIEQRLADDIMLAALSAGTTLSPADVPRILKVRARDYAARKNGEEL